MRVTHRGAALGALLAAAVPAASTGAPRSAHDYCVSSHRSDTNTGARCAPFVGIQRALDSAGRVSTVHPAPGLSFRDFAGRSPGGTVTGPTSTVVQSSGTSRAAAEARHGDVRLTGFTVDPTQESGYRKKPVHAMGLAPGCGVDGLPIARIDLHGSREDRVRLRSPSVGAEVRVGGDAPDGGTRNNTEGNALPFNSAGATSSKPPRRARDATAPWQAAPTATRQEPVDTVASRRTPHDLTPHNTRHNQQ
ncbi:hypothetical protein [Nocardiopsis sp. CNT312]|uniref:hypothetical protein n=1 Tax=Nocardiopsis sp. CNT312 TaxID=1137268 RepID=UPI0004905FDB|nr:hypothetical protein [Nocardiopsis sp. CNT312]